MAKLKAKTKKAETPMGSKAKSKVEKPIKKKATKKGEEAPQSTPGFKALVSCKNLEVNQVYAGYEIEKRWVLMTKEEDHTKNKNALIQYDEVLQKGVLIKQGYIKDIQKAKEVIDALGIELLNDFKPSTVRLRKYGEDYVFTLKDRKETKRREAEFHINEDTFMKYWPLTEGSRVYKKRLVKVSKGNNIEIDAFLDRLLLLAEIEVTDEAKLEALPKLGMDVTGNKSWTNKSLSK